MKSKDDQIKDWIAEMYFDPSKMGKDLRKKENQSDLAIFTSHLMEERRNVLPFEPAWPIQREERDVVNLMTPDEVSFFESLGKEREE